MINALEALALSMEYIDEQGGGGGTVVEANPSGEATSDLEKLKVASTIYGLITKNDLTEAVANLIAKSETSGLVKNDGTIDTNSYATTDDVKANTKLIAETVGWSGKNKWKNSLLKDSALNDNSGGSHSFTDGVLNVQTTSSDNSGAYYSGSSLRSVFSGLTGKYKLSFEYKSSIACAGEVGENTAKTSGVMPTDWTKYEAVINDITQIYAVVFYNKDTTKTPLISVRNIMLCPPDIIDDTYEPCRDTVAYPRDEQEIMGALNQWPALANGYSHTEETVTFTWLDDGSVEINGASTDDFYYYYVMNDSGLARLRGNWVACLKDVGSLSGVAFALYKNTSGSLVSLTAANTEASITLTDAEHASGKVGIYIGANKTFDHVVVKPVLYPATVPADTPFYGYAMSNRELTKKVQGIIDAVANSADFASFKTAIASL